MIYKRFFKRFFDILAALLIIAVLSPLFIVLIIVLTFSNKGAGIFFTQKRPGLGGKIFKIIKFKTMTDATDECGVLLPDMQRMTKVGKLIRSLSFDEIPQLLNVLKGDMSLIGPRPLLPKYLPLYNSFQYRRHEVRPGITGWAQVNGRNSLSWERKFELDVYYVERLSFLLDVRILLLTIRKIVSRKDINSSTDTTMKPFTGNFDNHDGN